MLSDDQIQELYHFVEKKQVRYYDIQTELVSHLSSAIEIRMKQDPGLDFGQALDKVYKGYGISGFSQIVREKEEAVTENQRRIFYQFVHAQFRLPVLLMMPVTAFLLERIIFYGGEIALAIMFISLLLGALLLTFITGARLRRIRKQHSKQLVIARYLYQSDWIYAPFYLAVIGNFLYRKEFYTMLAEHTAARIITALLLSVYITVLLAHYRTFKKVVLQIEEVFSNLQTKNGNLTSDPV